MNVEVGTNDTHVSHTLGAKIFSLRWTPDPPTFKNDPSSRAKYFPRLAVGVTGWNTPSLSQTPNVLPSSVATAS